jgi:chromosome partitioning protein
MEQQQQQKEAKIIALGNQKGGVGKSLITSLIANYMHQKTKHKVCVIDADDMQRTLSEQRKLDIIEGIDETNLYNIIDVDSINITTSLELLSNEFDFIFLDLPGNMKQKGVIESYAHVDHIFIPHSLSEADINSTDKFLTFIIEKIAPIRAKNGLDTKINLVLNRVNPATIEFKKLDHKNKEGYMSSYLPNSIVDFQRKASTHLMYDKPDYIDFAKEFVELITQR